MHPKDPKAEKPARALRVRSRRLDQVDEAKLALALALMARRLIEERTEPHTTEPRKDAAPPSRREVA